QGQVEGHRVEGADEVEQHGLGPAPLAVGQVVVVEPVDQAGQQVGGGGHGGMVHGAGSNHTEVMVAPPMVSTVWGTAAGIHSARDRGSTHARSPRPMVSTPAAATETWGARWGGQAG